MATVLGVDLGGTKILAGVVDTSSGKLLSEARKRTHAERGGNEVAQRFVEVAREALDGSGVSKGQVSMIGIGIAGQVDEEGRRLDRAPNLPEGILGTALIEAAEQALSMRAMLFNDVQAAAAGEAAFGAGQGHSDFVCIFSGTGIGGAVYMDGKPYRGATNTAGELGHMVIDYGGRLCGCGGEGHLEAYASRTAIVRSVLGAIRLGRASSLAELAPDPDPFNPQTAQIRSKALGRAVKDGDPVATEMVSEGARYMGAGLVSIVNFYNPPLIVLGGGIVQEVDLFFDLASERVRQDALQVPRGEVRIVKAALGDNSGVVGAAVLAARR